MVRPEATVKCCGGSRGDAAGTKSGSSSVERITVNTGTASVLAPPPRCQRDRPGWVHRRPIGSGRGGAAVVVRGRGSPPPGEGRQRCRAEGKLQWQTPGR